jgi:hypothetical protein
MIPKHDMFFVANHGSETFSTMWYEWEILIIQRTGKGKILSFLVCQAVTEKKCSR